MRDPIVLTELDYYDKAAGAEKTLRVCNGVAYRLRGSEAPPHALYRPFLVDPGWCRVDVFSRPGQYGHVTPGEIVLDDSSGELGAALINCAFDGRRIVQYIGERGAAYPGGFTVVIDGTVDGQPSFDWGRITVRPVDAAAALRRPLQLVRYGGSNVLPNGIDGLDDIAGRVAPAVLALASNMTPVCVNTARQIYHVSIPTGPAAVAVPAARDRGVPLTAAASVYASLAALQDDAQAPAAGQYKTLASAADGTYFRLGSAPVGAVTCDAVYGTAADRTHAQVWARIMALAGVSGASISSVDVAALDAALPGEIEFALFDERDAADALTEVATSARAAWYGDATGVYRIVQWSAPSGAPLDTLTALRTDSMDIADAVGSGDVAPAYRVTLQYGRNWTPQRDADLGGDKTSALDAVRASGGRAGLAARAWLAEEYRTVTAEDASVLEAHRNAVELTPTSLLADAAAAQAFAEAELALYKVARHMTTLSLWLSPAQIDALRVNGVVTVVESRWGYDAGRLMRIAGIQIDRGTGKTELRVWG